MKKGFTLIELLAVIVILAIIALIATPIVLNIIKDSKESSNERSLEMYKDALEMSVASYLMDKPSSFTDEYYTKDDGKTLYKKSDNTSVLSIDYSGSKVTCDSVLISERGKVTYSGCKVNGKNVGPQPKPAICKRAETLHTEECTQTDATDYCSGAGYTTGSTITYGNESVTEGTLTSGDAFDCDVNGDEKYDSDTERFYYVSGKDGDSSSDYATLIYYNNVSEGDPNNSKLYAYSGANNYQGPVTAIAQLPTTTQWSNVSLSSPARSITNELGENTVSLDDAHIYTLPTAFSYSGYAARLLTAQEVDSACGITEIISDCAVASFDSCPYGELDSCNYLMENTQYSSSLLGTDGYWLETPFSGTPYTAWLVGVRNRYKRGRDINEDIYGVRPVIEVLKSEIDY